MIPNTDKTDNTKTNVVFNDTTPPATPPATNQNHQQLPSISNIVMNGHIKDNDDDDDDDELMSPASPTPTLQSTDTQQYLMPLQLIPLYPNEQLVSNNINSSVPPLENNQALNNASNDQKVSIMMFVSVVDDEQQIQQSEFVNQDGFDGLRSTYQQVRYNIPLINRTNIKDLSGIVGPFGCDNSYLAVNSDNGQLVQIDAYLLFADYASLFSQYLLDMYHNCPIQFNKILDYCIYASELAYELGIEKIKF